MKGNIDIEYRFVRNGISCSTNSRNGKTGYLSFGRKTRVRAKGCDLEQRGGGEGGGLRHGGLR